MGLPFSFIAKFVPGLDAVTPPLAGTSAQAASGSWPLMQLAPDSIRAPMPDSVMSSAMTWTARLPTPVELGLYSQLCWSPYLRFSAPAIWSAGIA